MGKYMISIIVPAYNVEGYISRCLDSISSQSYSDYEVIVVNDGSTDSTRDIIEEKAKLNDKIKLYNTENNGVTRARYLGWEQCKGDYVAFLDADDEIEFEYLDSFLKVKGFEKYDIIVSGYRRISENGKVLSNNPYDNGELSQKEYIDFLFDTDFGGSPWGKLFNRKVISDYCFDLNRNISFKEDVIMNMVISSNVKSVKVISETLYRYRVRKGSAITELRTSNYEIEYFDTINDKFIRTFGSDCKLPESMIYYNVRFCLYSLAKELLRFEFNFSNINRIMSISLENIDVTDFNTKMKIIHYSFLLIEKSKRLLDVLTFWKFK
ncbi:glycosyltransferase family 2 protein [Vibrio sp. RE86]|uniref:glycosyltransferase family 2 protein n=1 Tax=Vibrio sp. RE86 TaxID=2607605 RepID=UPI001493D01E|nr:glycosyltransferase family 2 protein [Vibrio sp. RE86]NOH79909.1 glycosyltransferase family 2 protein [Vibrio sp. RE86]